MSSAGSKKNLELFVRWTKDLFFTADLPVAQAAKEIRRNKQNMEKKKVLLLLFKKSSLKLML